MKRTLVITLLFFISPYQFAFSAIYKCENAVGDISFQSSPCKNNDKKTVIKSSKKIAPLTAGTRDFKQSQFVGVWCFYEQSAIGNTVAEKVTINLKQDGSYSWSDALGWNQ